jgi:hypothetical protein
MSSENLFGAFRIELYHEVEHLYQHNMKFQLVETNSLYPDSSALEKSPDNKTTSSHASFKEHNIFSNTNARDSENQEIKDHSDTVENSIGTILSSSLASEWATITFPISIGTLETDFKNPSELSLIDFKMPDTAGAERERYTDYQAFIKCHCINCILEWAMFFSGKTKFFTEKPTLTLMQKTDLSLDRTVEFALFQSLNRHVSREEAETKLTLSEIKTTFQYWEGSEDYSKICYDDSHPHNVDRTICSFLWYVILKHSFPDKLCWYHYNKKIMSRQISYVN